MVLGRTRLSSLLKQSVITLCFLRPMFIVFCKIWSGRSTEHNRHGKNIEGGFTKSGIGVGGVKTKYAVLVLAKRDKQQMGISSRKGLRLSTRSHHHQGTFPGTVQLCL